MLSRLRPSWQYTPTHDWESGNDGDCGIEWEKANFSLTTGDGNTVVGSIKADSHHSWTLDISVNEVVVLQLKVYSDQRVWTEMLSPYLESIPAVRDWKQKEARRIEEAHQKSQLSLERANAFKKKHGF